MQETIFPVPSTFSSSLVKDIQDYFIENHLTLALAESCTGGLLAAMLVEISGSSAYFKGGVVSYCNEVKHNILEVDDDIFRREGAVSRACAEAMANGARKILKSDYAVSLTGVAGPDGGSAEKPVGTVWIAVAAPSDTTAIVHHFQGDRTSIRLQAAYTALKMLQDVVLGE